MTHKLPDGNVLPIIADPNVEDGECVIVKGDKVLDARMLLKEREDLRAENAELKQLLSGRTMSCGRCGEIEAENARLREALKDYADKNNWNGQLGPQGGYEMFWAGPFDGEGTPWYVARKALEVGK